MPKLSQNNRKSSTFSPQAALIDSQASLQKLNELRLSVPGGKFASREERNTLASLNRSYRELKRAIRSLTTAVSKEVEAENPLDVRLKNRLLNSPVRLRFFLALMELNQDKNIESAAPRFFDVKSISDKKAEGQKSSGNESVEIMRLSAPSWGLMIPEKQWLAPEKKRYAPTQLAIEVYKKFQAELDQKNKHYHSIQPKHKTPRPPKNVT